MIFVIHPRQFAFVHVYRTGGTSVQEALIRQRGLTIGYKHLPHQSILDAIQDCPDIRDALKVAVVRNPWTWLVSQYCFVNSPRYGKNRHAWHRKTRDFEDFVRRYTTDYPYRYKTQADFVCDEHASLLVDKLYSFECLHRLWQDMRDYFGVRVRPLHLLQATPRGANIEGYYTSDLREYVRDAFTLDFALHRRAARDVRPLHAVRRARKPKTIRR